MGHGKIEIKKIENQTNRQVTYSKRRNGIFKKAQELTVLCDAKVSIIMLSGTGKLHEFISPNISTKKIYDQYRKALGIDLWSTHYERMQVTLRKLKEVNNNLRREIRHRIGEDLGDLKYDELADLEQKILSSLEVIRERKLHDIRTKTTIGKKKVQSLEQMNGNLLQIGARYEDPHYDLADNEPDYESTITRVGNGQSNLYPFRLPHDHHLNVRQGGGFGFRDLRLA